MHGILLTALIAMAVGAVLCFIILPYAKRTKAQVAEAEERERIRQQDRETWYAYRRMQHKTKSRPLEDLAIFERRKREAILYAASLGGPAWTSQYLSRRTPASPS